MDGYASVLDGSDFVAEPKLTMKSEISDFLDKSFSHFSSSLDKINLNDLYKIKHPKSTVEPWKDFTIFDIISLGYNHTTHHIAQATVYLRLYGITPPKYRF